MNDGTGTDEIDAIGGNEAGREDMEIVSHVIVNNSVAGILMNIIEVIAREKVSQCNDRFSRNRSDNLLWPPADLQQSVADWESKSVIFPFPVNQISIIYII